MSVDETNRTTEHQGTAAGGSPPRGVRVIAIIEAAKGGLVLLVGFGAFTLVHVNVQGHAEELVRHFHLNPASRYPRVFLELAGASTPARLLWLAFAAAGYAFVRLTEAYGLWRGRAWAEWLAALGGAVYLPIELWELSRGVTGLRVGTFVANLVIVGYMATRLGRRLRGRSAAGCEGPGSGKLAPEAPNRTRPEGPRGDR